MTAPPAVTVDAEFRLGLQRVLSRLQDKDSFSIVQADLGDPDPLIRAGAIRLIGELELKEFLPNIMERLQKLYGKHSKQVEMDFTVAVFNALEKIGTAEISDELARRFEQLTEKLRSPALQVIAAHGAGSTVVDGFFQGLLRPDTPYPKLRAHAVELYASMAPGHPDPKTVVALIRKFLKDPELPVALASALALTKLLGERVFQLPEWSDISIEAQSEMLMAAPAVPSAVLEAALKSEAVVIRQASVQRVLSASTPPEAVRDVIRLHSTDDTEESVVADQLTAGLGRWYSSNQNRLVLVQTFSYILRRHAGVLEKFLPTPGTVLGDMDKILARLRRAMLRTGSEKISEALLKVLMGKGSPKDVTAAVDEQMTAYPKEKELRSAISEMLAITDDRIRKRIASEVRAIPAGAFIPIKKILKILPPLREPSLTTPLRLVQNLARVHADADLEWVATTQLAACGEAAALTIVCDAVLKGVPDPSKASSETAVRLPADVSIWVRSLSMDTANARVRSTLLAIIQRSEQPETFRAAVETLTAKVDAEVSNILMRRLPGLKGLLRFIVIQAIGRMGDRVHLPVFLSELKAAEEDRQLAGLLGLEKLLDANPTLPSDTVTTPLYELKNHKSSFVRASAISLLSRLKDPNRVELVSNLISSDGSIPLGAYRLVHELVDQEIGDDERRALFQALVTRIGRMTMDDEETICEAFRKVLGENQFAAFLQARRQRSDAVEDLKDLLRKRASAQASTDYQISKSIQRRAIVFLDITGFTPRASRMSAIELGVFLVQVEDEILPFIEKHKGILIKRLGDGFLLSFPGSIEAVVSCLEMLHYLAKKNQLLQEDDRVRLRAGIHVGDVLVDRDDVFGDTVNMAARVEAQAKPMCICLTQDVHAELPKRTDAIECMGPTKLKGKEEPVTLYLIRLDVIYEAQTEAIQKLMASPDWIPKIERFEKQLEERYQKIKEKLEEARHMVEHGDYTHAESLVEEIEKLML